jgi:hypothetical protein
MSYRDAIYGRPKPPAAKPTPAVVVWHHIHPDGCHVVSARLRDGRVIRCIGRPVATHDRPLHPGDRRGPYEELRAWVTQSD